MPAPDPLADLALLTDAAREAGAIALPFWRASPETWDKADGAGPVTEADLAVNAHLHDTLRAARPDYGWLSEETPDDAARLSCDTCFIVDPIDGTRAFVAGQSAWSHSLAIAHRGQVTAAAVYLPVPDKLYTAAKGHGATLNGARVRASDAADPDTATILASRPVMERHHWRGPHGLTRHFRPSLAYRLCLVAEGRFDAMLAIRATWEWDIAAGTLIVTEAGGMASTRTGAPLTFNTPNAHANGTLAAAPGLHRALLEQLA